MENRGKVRSGVASRSDEGPVGILAGWGAFPLEVAYRLRRSGRSVIGIGIKGHADARLAEQCDAFRYIGIARLGAQIRYFRRHGVTTATMAGKIFKAKLMFHRFGWFHLLPDWRCIRAFHPYFVTFRRDRKDDTLLGAVVDEFAKDGIEFKPATDLAPQLLLEEGHWTGPRLSSREEKDIAFGWEIAKELGRLDVGQSVAVKGLACLAAEAVEGTDACIRRAGELCAQGGFVVVKVAKPQQDMRFDVPTIGVGTIESLRHAGGTVLAVEAHKTIIVDRPSVFRLAQRYRIRLVSVVDGKATGLTDRRGQLPRSAA